MVKTILTNQRACAIEWLQEKLGGEWLEARDISEILEQSLKEDHHLEGIHRVYWSLGYCQGDGVAFEGHIDVEVLRGHQPELDEMMSVCEAAAALLGTEFDIAINRCEVSHHGRYYHENSMDLQFEWDYGTYDSYGGCDQLDAMLEQIRDWLESYIVRVSRALEKMGYAEIEYRGSAEYAAEYLDNNPELLAQFQEEQEFPVGS